MAQVPQPTDSRVDKITQSILQEIEKIVKKEVKVYGEEFGELLKLSLLANQVSSMLYDVLTYPPPKGVKEKSQENYNIKTVEFQAMKRDVADAVSAGVTAAMGRFTGKQVDYFCMIQPAPEPKNATFH